MATPKKLIELKENSVLDDTKYDASLQQVFARLPIAERYKMREVCKRWKRISEMPWKDMTRLNGAYSWSRPKTLVSEITLSRLGEVLRLCGNYLTHFDFSGNYPMLYSMPVKFNADVKFFSLLAAHCPNLKILDIYILTPSPEGVAYMADNYNRISDFRIYDYDSTCNEALSLFFKKAQKLDAITFYNCGKNYNCLLDLPVTTIKEIHIAGLHDETADQLCSVLQKCRNLKRFSIRSTWMKERNLTGITEALAVFANSLEQLDLKDNAESVYVFEPSHFTEFKNLQVLRIFSARIDDDILEIIGKNSRQLKSFLLSLADRVTDRGIKALPNLDHIDLRALPLVKGQFLAEMFNLKTARLSHCGITDRYLHILLDTAKSLQFLDFRSFEYHDIKEFILHASDVVKERKTRIPLEIVLDAEGKIKPIKRDLLHVRNAE